MGCIPHIALKFLFPTDGVAAIARKINLPIEIF